MVIVVTKMMEFFRRPGTQEARTVSEVGPVSVFRWSGSEPVEKELQGAENI